MSVRLARCVTGRRVSLIRQVFDGAPADAINLGLGQPTDAVPAVVREAAERAMASGLAPYSATAGMKELRAAIGDRVYQGDGFESVLVTSGSQEALWVALMGLVDPGDEVIIAEPAYPAYRTVVEMIGAHVVSVKLDFASGFRIDPAAVEAAWSPRTRAVIVASPANPTGMMTATPDELESIHALCADRDAWLISDEVYAPLRYDQAPAPIARGDRMVTVAGISKAFSCMGFRVGWVHARPEVIQGLVPLHQQVALCAPTVGQTVALACMELWGEPYFSQLRGHYAARRAAAVTALRAVGNVRFHEPEGAFYVFADVARYATDTFALAMRMREQHKVITAPGEAFGDAAGYLRISFATTPELVTEGIRRIGEALHGD